MPNVATFLDADKRFRLRFGQSKVPYGWENMQSSSGRLTLDRSDAINGAVPSERDTGIIAYHTPTRVDRIWERLSDDGQKLFGNYGAFGVGIFNGQGVNREESNDNIMTVALATWPFPLDGLGLLGQVLEIGGAALRNRVQPETRTGGVSDTLFPEERVALYAILYPQPIGFQAEWNWGRGPEYDRDLRAITTRNLNGGYVPGDGPRRAFAGLAVHVLCTPAIVSWRVESVGQRAPAGNRRVRAGHRVPAGRAAGTDDRLCAHAAGRGRRTAAGPGGRQPDPHAVAAELLGCSDDLII